MPSFFLIDVIHNVVNCMLLSDDLCILHNFPNLMNALIIVSLRNAHSWPPFEDARTCMTLNSIVCKGCQDMSIHALRHLFSFCSIVSHSVLVSLDSRLTKNEVMNRCQMSIQQIQSIFSKIYYLFTWSLIKNICYSL